MRPAPFQSDHRVARAAPVARHLAGLAAFFLLAASLAAGLVRFDLPAQPAAAALLEFSRQAGVEVVFPYDALREPQANAVQGALDPADAMARLLEGTGFTARRNSQGKFVVKRSPLAPGSVRGQVTGPGGAPLPGARLLVRGTSLAAESDRAGQFSLRGVPAGSREIVVTAEGFQPQRLAGVAVEPSRITRLDTLRLEPAGETAVLDPFVVEAHDARLRLLDDSAALLGPRRATGNLDLPRTENEALPFAIYSREQLSRSGVVALNEFLQRVVLESDATASTPEQGGFNGPVAGSTNLNLRSYGENETVILVNGRRLPEILTSVDRVLPPDVNFIPLSLVQQVEVLPVSAAALYAGDPVGGVINIVLRPDVTATEVLATYTNATGGFAAPQASVALQHGQSFLGGALRVRLNASFTRSEPATEAELGYRRAHAATLPVIDGNLHRATPNIRSLDGTPLFGPGSAAVTSVAPGADGTGGSAAFVGRAGVRSLDFFDSPGGIAASLDSIDSPYGRRQQQSAWFASVTADPTPWLQLGADATLSRTIVNRGYEVIAGNLELPAASPCNPFGRAIGITLNETAPGLGEEYSEARIDYSSVVGGALLRLPREWRATLDAQLAHNVVRYRGLAGADADRWQELVEQGAYNPFRDTQRFAAPAAFSDRVLVYRGGPGRFVTLGDYRTLDVAARISNQEVPLPTGRGALVAGADYRKHSLASFREDYAYADGSSAGDSDVRRGRTLERYSFFTELRGPVVAPRRLPDWLKGVEGDLAVRYVASEKSNEVNVAPTMGLKADLAGGVSFRGSITTSNRFPTPQMSRPVGTPSGPGGINRELIYDPRRQQFYQVVVDEAIDPGLAPEEAVTQTAGIIFQRGERRRFRAALDYVDTRKTNEILALDAQALVSVESVFPDRVDRAPLATGDTHPAGYIEHLTTGSVNASWRHSRNWNASADYTWSELAGGTLELHGRLVYFQSYQRQVFANSPVVDQLRLPDGTAPGLLRYRAFLSAAWSSPRWGLGLDGQYFHSRRLPLAERAGQGDKQVQPYWQFDAHVRADLKRFLPWREHKVGLQAQLRVNNLFATGFPRYASNASGAGLQPYGDWRGRTYSLSLVAAF